MYNLHDLFLLMFNLSQLRDKNKIIEIFNESINELFQPHIFIFSEKNEGNKAYHEEIVTHNFHFGYFYSNVVPNIEIVQLVQNAIQMLAVILDRLRIESELKERANSLEIIAEKRLDEIEVYVKELEAAKLASLNLIEDLKSEIVERKKIEEALSLGEEKFRLAFQTSPDSININRLKDGVYIEINEGFTKMTGFTVKDVIGKSSFEIHIWENPEDRRKLVVRLKKTGKVENLEAKFKKKDGSSVYGLMSAAVIQLYNEPHIISITRDISAIKAAQIELQTSESRFRTAFENSATGMCLTSLDGKFLQVNTKLIKILGYSKNELLQLTFQNITYPDDISKSNVLVENAIDYQVDTFYFEKRYIKKDGEIIWVEVSSTLLRDTNNKPIYFITHFIDISERKQAEEALLFSEKKFARAFLISPEAMAMASMDTGKYLDVNEVFLRITGYKRSEVIGFKSGDLNLWVNSGERDEYITQLASKGQIRDFETRFRMKSGELRDFLVSSSVIEIDGKPYSLNYINDITERKIAEEKIREKDIQFRKLSANVPDLLFQFTRRADGTYYVPIASRGIINIFGCKPEDVLEDFDAIARVIHPEDIERVINQIEYSAKNLTNFICEFRVNIPGKPTQWIYSKSTPEKLPDGVVTWYGFNTNITEQKNSENALRESEERYRKLLVNLEAGVVVHEADTSIKLNNQRASELLGLSDDQMRGKMAIDTYWKFIHENNAPFTLGEYPVNRVLKTKKAFQNLILGVVQTQKSDIVWLTVNGLPVLDESGNISEILISFIEISELKRTSEEIIKLNQDLELRVAQRTSQLEAVNKELESFIYSISHDLRAPLRSIMGFSQIISRRHIANLNKEGLEYFGFIQEASQNMANLIEDLLHFSRMAKNKIDKESINLNDLLELVKQNLNQDIIEQKAKIIYSDNLPEILGDRSLLIQIFSNLVQNAIAYHREGVTPEVNITMEENVNNFIIKVADNAQGIPKQYHEKIFNLFQRLHSNDTFPGTGIGLAIVKKAVKALGGNIKLESEINKGTTFILNFPKD